MSLVLNMIGGGGGSFTATDAILRVQAPARSIVTISKGSTSKSDGGHENDANHAIFDYYFIIHQSQFDSLNPWTVTVTRGTDTASTTIIINNSEEYDLLINLHVPIEQYQEVEYLQSTGVLQYINTGVSSVDGVDIAFQHVSYPGEYCGVFGAMNGVSSADGFALVADPTNDCAVVGGVWTVLTERNYDKHHCTMGVNFSNILTFDGLEIGTTSGRKSTQNTSLFAVRYSQSWSNLTNARIFHAKLYKGTSLVREFYPCYRLSDSVPGMYDKANGVFYTKSGGNGNFIVGEDV